MLRRRSAALVTGVLTTALLVGGCAAEPGAGSGQVDVVAAFYPLQFVAERVGGDRVDVTNLTAPGAEPHDLELAPQDVARLADADLALYLAGFQPAVDDAATQAGAGAVDVSSAARADLAGTAPGSGTDPHFWLDPTRLADVGDAVAERLTEVDPDGAEAYAAGAAQLRSDLDELDAAFASGLAACDSRALVTSHAAFGYLADRYDLVQIGIAGLSPEAEPTATDLARVTTYVRDNDVTTIFYETLVSPDVAETVARETGATTAVLDPLEGLSSDSGDADYLSVMRTNLAALQAGLGCR